MRYTNGGLGLWGELQGSGLVRLAKGEASRRQAPGTSVGEVAAERVELTPL